MVVAVRRAAPSRGSKGERTEAGSLLGPPTLKGKQEDGSWACSFCRGEGRWGTAPFLGPGLNATCPMAASGTDPAFCGKRVWSQGCEMVQGGAGEVGWKPVKCWADRIECVGFEGRGWRRREERGMERGHQKGGGRVPRRLTQDPLQGAQSWGDQTLEGDPEGKREKEQGRGRVLGPV